MITRQQKRPDHSFFLFGPRGTGKTTWMKQVLPDALWFDLLRTQTLLALSRQPESFRQQVEGRPQGNWVVVDEVQRLPSLLNEVHALIAEHGARYRFALSGSSARKLKRMDVNLLAGRAINRQFFPLTASELNFDCNPDRVLRLGLLPQIQAETDYAVEALEAYVGNYIREEIQQEALVRNLESFARFLEVAALMNGQIVNVFRGASVHDKVQEVVVAWNNEQAGP
ncbi:MAG: AAA family ATPase [Kiritimatiellia bacterium]